MCITISKAELTKTKVYAGISNIDKKEVHVLCYSNEVRSKVPNAMILPIPTKELGKENFIDTRQFSEFLNDIARQSFIITDGDRDFGDNLLSDRRSRGINVFESGSYTCIVADQASDISSVLSSLPENKRPEIKQELLDFFSENYPSDKWKFLCCCWEGNLSPEPIMIYYVPSEPSLVYLPMLDSHDGTKPKESIVKTDHTIMFGFHSFDEEKQKNNNINLSHFNLPKVVKTLLPTKSIGKNMPRVKNNGDLFILSEELKNISHVDLSKNQLQSFNVFPNKNYSDMFVIDGKQNENTFR